MRGEQPDKEAFDKHVAALASKLDVYEKILSKQKYVAGNVWCFLHNYVNMNKHLCTFFYTGYHSSRLLSCRCRGIACKNGKRCDGIGVAAKCQEVKRPRCVLLLPSDSWSHHRWFKEVSSRPSWLAVKDGEVTSNLTY